MFSITYHNVLGSVAGRFVALLDNGEEWNISNGIDIETRSYLDRIEVVLYDNHSYNGYLETLDTIYINEDYPWGNAYSVSDIADYFPELWERAKDSDRLSWVGHYYDQRNWRADRLAHPEIGGLYLTKDSLDWLYEELRDYAYEHFSESDIVASAAEYAGEDEVFDLGKFADFLQSFSTQAEINQYFQDRGEISSRLNYLLNGEFANEALGHAYESVDFTSELCWHYDGDDGQDRVRVVGIRLEFDHKVLGPSVVFVSLDDSRANHAYTTRPA